MRFTPIEIENQKFDVRMRGYDRSQVKRFLSALAEDAVRLIGERNRLHEEKTQLEHHLTEFRKREKKIGESLLALRDLSEKMKEDAKKEADLIIREAHLKADQILEQARMEAVRLEGEIAEIRVERDTFEDRLRLLIDEHQRLLIQRRQSLDWKEPMRPARKKIGDSEQ